MSSFISSQDEQFHPGECAVQARVLGGAAQRGRMTAIGRMALRDHMPQQHRSFFAQLPWLLVGSVDAAGQPWASALAGPPGFVQSPGAQELQISKLPLETDPLHANLRVGAPVGFLGLEPHTRRRNRANGVVTSVSPDGFAVQVQMSFGNCPQYIAARQPQFVGPAERTLRFIEPAVPEPVLHLDAHALQLMAQADTFFIASAAPASMAHAARGVDMSHRGGKPGFVRVERDAQQQAVLTVPDFSGNFFFNTLGNLSLEPRAGLLFIDYASGDLLHLSVRVEIIWDGPQVQAFAGAQRLLRMTVTQVHKVSAALPLHWGPAQPSPVLADTGVWPSAPASGQ
ncbi:MAG: pyridoxamine 5'-phosphate oxidase family protein [Burkholderiaceae bacterium]